VQGSQFARRMPTWVAITLFNTGIGLKEGAEDPHWQIVRPQRTTAHFKPRPAVVTVCNPLYAVEQPQAIAMGFRWTMARQSSQPRYVHLSDDVRAYGHAAGHGRSAGKFIVDDYVTAIRLKRQGSAPAGMHDGT